MATMPAEIARIGGYHIGWWDENGGAPSSGGKAVRPALVLATAAAVGNGPAGVVRDRTQGTGPRPGHCPSRLVPS
ncbi:hypothetical protein JOF53_007360 [Crossiella equi]|uniref:Uncharacterized protein n=1 Tax=Crossiella equi TaxID=130796 RepID=A0ABS5APK0_9PSEU|nr:hypothetical protein [Crossiella equi]MBP2478488.1 hypothetical protein [Crossiella equi]